MKWLSLENKNSLEIILNICMQINANYVTWLNCKWFGFSVFVVYCIMAYFGNQGLSLEQKFNLKIFLCSTIHSSIYMST